MKTFSWVVKHDKKLIALPSDSVVMDSKGKKRVERLLQILLLLIQAYPGPGSVGMKSLVVRLENAFQTLSRSTLMYPIPFMLPAVIPSISSVMDLVTNLEFGIHVETLKVNWMNLFLPCMGYFVWMVLNSTAWCQALLSFSLGNAASIWIPKKWLRTTTFSLYIYQYFSGWLDPTSELSGSIFSKYFNF